jgi:cytochrome P450
MDTSHLRLDTIDIIGPDHYQKNGYPHAEWSLLRKEAPVYWFDRTDADPFWAITRHEDIVWLSKQPPRFVNKPRLAVFPETEPPEEGTVGDHLLVMDPPRHAAFRRVVSHRFTPRAVRRMKSDIDSDLHRAP